MSRLNQFCLVIFSSSFSFPFSFAVNNPCNPWSIDHLYEWSNIFSDSVFLNIGSVDVVSSWGGSVWVKVLNWPDRFFPGSLYSTFFHDKLCYRASNQYPWCTGIVGHKHFTPLTAITVALALQEILTVLLAVMSRLDTSAALGGASSRYRTYCRRGMAYGLRFRPQPNPFWLVLFLLL